MKINNFIFQPLLKPFWITVTCVLESQMFMPVHVNNLFFFIQKFHDNKSSMNSCSFQECCKEGKRKVLEPTGTKHLFAFCRTVACSVNKSMLKRRKKKQKRSKIISIRTKFSFGRKQACFILLTEFRVQTRSFRSEHFLR